MTRAEWNNYYRAFRIAAKVRFGPFELHASALTDALKELYGYILEPEGDAFCRLVDRYRDKLGPQHFEKYDLLKKEGKIRAGKYMKELVYGTGSFTKMIEKGDDFGEACIPIPLKYDR